MSTGNAENETLSKMNNAEPGKWLRFLPRWALITGLFSLMIPIVFLGGVGQQISDNALGAEFVELLQAIRSPGMFRAAWAIDAIVWLMLGSILIVFAGILSRQATILAVFIAVCGVAQIFGALGSFLRLDGISNLAGYYIAALPDQKAILLEAYLNLHRIINPINHIAVLLQGTGFLLVSWKAIKLQGFPRWLAVWISLPGLLAVAQFVLFVTDAGYLFTLNVIGLIGGNIALNIAIALKFWRPPDLLISSVNGKFSKY